MPASTLTALFAGLVTGLLSGSAAIVFLAEILLHAGVADPAHDIFATGDWAEPFARYHRFAPY